MEPESSLLYSQVPTTCPWANSIQSPPPPTSWRSILILSSHLRLGLPNGLFRLGFSTRTRNGIALIALRYITEWVVIPPFLDRVCMYI